MTHHEKHELARVGAWLVACATISVVCAVAGVIGAVVLIVVMAVVAVHVWARHR